MEEKEKIIEMLRELTNVDVKSTLLNLKMNQGNFYAKRYSTEKMRLVYDTLTDELVKILKKQGKI